MRTKKYFSINSLTKMKCLFFILFTLVASTFGATTTVFPIADSYLDSGNPNTNYGSEYIGYVYQDIYGAGIPYFDLICMFNISTLPGIITKAEVIYQQIYISSDEIYGPFLAHDVYEISTNWTESTVTWSNPPTTLRKTETDYQDNDIYHVIFPVTTIYEDAKSNSKQLIAARLHSTYQAVSVSMREDAIQYRPVLKVTY